MSDKKKNQDIRNAMKFVQQVSEQTEEKQNQLAKDLEDTLSESDEVLRKYAHLIDEPKKEESVSSQIPQAPYIERSFEDIRHSAKLAGIESTSISDLLSQKDFQEVVRDYDRFVLQWEANRKLDKYDWMATGVVSSLSICVNWLFVGEGTAQAGKQLLTWMGAPTGHVPDAPKVSFDKTLSRVFGAAGNHRWNSVSHHTTPAGFIHAVRDVLKNTSTHIVNGEVVITDSISDGIRNTWAKESFGSGFVAKLLTACVIVLEHWWSDVNTSLGLPGPLMMLAKFLEFGKIEYNGRTFTIAEVAQRLFDPKNGQSGMDVRRFIGDSLVVFSCDILMRLWFFCRAIYEKRPLSDVFRQLIMHPKLQTSLLVVHGSSCLFNAGTVYATQNPLLINTAQWMAFGRYLGGYLTEGITKDAQLNKDHQKRWVEKMRQQSSNLKTLQSELQHFPPLRI